MTNNQIVDEEITIKIKTNTKSHKPGKTSNPSLLADGDSVERSIKKNNTQKLIQIQANQQGIF